MIQQDGEALLVIPQDRQVMHTGETVEETSGGEHLIAVKISP
jgi:hypothetical protein